MEQTKEGSGVNSLIPIGKGVEVPDSDRATQRQSVTSSPNTPLSAPLFQIQPSACSFQSSAYPPPQGSTMFDSGSSQMSPPQKSPGFMSSSDAYPSLPKVLDVPSRPRETASVPLQEIRVSQSATVCPNLQTAKHKVAFSSTSSVPVSSAGKPLYLKPHTPTNGRDHAPLLPTQNRIRSAGAVKPPASSSCPVHDPLTLSPTNAYPMPLPPPYRPDEYTVSPRNFLLSADAVASTNISCPPNPAYQSILSPSKHCGDVDQNRGAGKHITISPEVTEYNDDGEKVSQHSDNLEYSTPSRRRKRRHHKTKGIHKESYPRHASLGVVDDESDHSKELFMCSPRSRKSVVFNEMKLAQPPEDADTATGKVTPREDSRSLLMEKSRSFSKFGSLPFDDFYLSPSRWTQYSNGSGMRKEDPPPQLTLGGGGSENLENERSYGTQHSRSLSFAPDASMEQMWKRKHSRSKSFRKRKETTTSPRKEGGRKLSHRGRRRGSKRRRRSSIYKNFGSIMNLPDGAYKHGSPFRNDRFADLGPCPRTNVRRVFCYNIFGNPMNPAIILINGLGSGCTLWPVDFCHHLSMNGLFVIRFDNRDAGLSTHWDGFKAFSVYKAALMGLLSKGSPPYTLKDMARDTLDLMDYICVDKAHVLGISMGGMIAQWMALLAPERVKSLCLIATHCPGHRVESPSLKLMISNFLDSPKRNDLDSVVEYYIRRRQELMGDYNADSPAVRDLFRKSIIRSPGDKKATRRQFWAVQSEESQSKPIRALSEKSLFPVLIIHGKQDRLIPIANARALNDDWVGSELRVFEKMGHNLPEELTEALGEVVTKVVERGELWADTSTKKKL